MGVLGGLSKRAGTAAGLLCAIAVAGVPATADDPVRKVDVVERCATQPDRERQLAWAIAATGDVSGSEHRATAYREVAKLCAASRRFDDAEAIAARIPDASTRSTTLLDIAIERHRAGRAVDRHRAGRAVDRHRAGRPDEAGRILATGARRTLAAAKDTVVLIADDARRWSVVRAVMATMEAMDRFDDALALSSGIAEPAIRSMALADLGIVRARAGDTRRAGIVAAGVDAPEYRSDVQAAVAAAHAAAGETDRADRAFLRAIEAVATARAIEFAPRRVLALVAIAAVAPD